jgi:hypothetical protein
MRISYKSIAMTLLSLGRVIRKSRFFVKFPNVELNNNTCLIFGNGPSLTNDICKKIDNVKNIDTFCVGRFAESQLYQLVKPKYYVFADPVFWQSKPPEKAIAMRTKLFNEIKNNTSWELTICAPFESMCFFKDCFSSNPNIKFCFYNNVPISGIKLVINYLYDFNLGLPLAQNVLIPSLYMALKIGYKNVILLGADHSWHETLTLDKYNRPCLKDRHFYDKNVDLRPFTIDGSDENIFTMASLFQAIGLMFEGYLRIYEYALRQNSQILNASSETYIDAFPRLNFNEALSSIRND